MHFGNRHVFGDKSVLLGIDLFGDPTYCILSIDLSLSLSLSLSLYVCVCSCVYSFVLPVTRASYRDLVAGSGHV